MEVKSVFLFQPYDMHEQYTVLSTDMDGIDQQLLTKLANEGKGIEVSLGPYNEYLKKAEQLHSEYIKAEKRIKESDNPLHTAEYKQYELAKAWEAYEEGSKTLQSEWDEERAQIQREARANAARATIPVSQSDRTTAEQLADRISLNIAGIVNKDQVAELLAEVTEDIRHLSDPEKTALQGKLPAIIDQFEAKAQKYGSTVNTSGLVSATKDTRNMQLLGYEVAKQLPVAITDNFDTKTLVRDARKGKRRSKFHRMGKA